MGRSKINVVSLKVTADGSGDGVVVSAPVSGKVKGIRVKYEASSAAGTDVVITSSGQTLLTLTNNNASGFYYPKVPAQDGVGTDVTYDGVNEIYVDRVIGGRDGTITLTIAQQTAAKYVQVEVFVEEY